MFEFLSNNLITFIEAMIVLIVLVVILSLVRRWIAATKNPQVKHFQEGLMPFIYTCILGAEKTAQDFLKQFGKQLEGADKKKIADSWYALIPDSIPVNGKWLPVGEVKQFVTREMFQEWVKTAYDKMNADVVKASAYLRKQVDYLVPDQFEPGKPGYTPPTKNEPLVGFGNAQSNSLVPQAGDVG